MNKPISNPNQEPKHTCLQCGITSQGAPLLNGESNGKEVWICVRCLPMLIHGAH